MVIRGVEINSAGIMYQAQNNVKRVEDKALKDTQQGQGQGSFSDRENARSYKAGSEKDADVREVNAAVAQPQGNTSQGNKPESTDNDVRFNKAYFAVDENKNVVIRVVDDDGNVVRQIPPEDYLKMVETMKKNIDSIFTVKNRKMTEVPGDSGEHLFEIKV